VGVASAENFTAAVELMIEGVRVRATAAGE
jgi:hypothetical protein